MKTAVIGLGNIGRQVSLNLIAGGENIIVADHTAGKAEAFARESGGRAKASTVSAAIEEADVLVFAVYFDAIKQLLSEYGRKLVGKIIVDPSNPIAPDGKGGFKKIIPQKRVLGPDTCGVDSERGEAGEGLRYPFGSIAWVGGQPQARGPSCSTRPMTRRRASRWRS
jgi:8-hydroxy-5-deazaflavin:NADPH oxidoreductase